MTPEAKAKLFAELDAEFGIVREPAQPPKPKVVAEAGRVIAPAEVRVSEADPNWPNSRGGFVRIDMEAYERQRLEREREAAEWKRRHREIDPFGYGHWGAAED